METFYFLIILVIALAFYGYYSMAPGRLEFVQCVEAGPTQEVDARRLRQLSFHDRRRTIRRPDGRRIGTAGMMRIVVKGNCMKPRHIETGAQLLVQKIDRHTPLAQQIKQGDILLIHLTDNGIHKIRIFDKYTDDGLLTYRFDDNGERQDSSRRHSEASVVGIVRYRL